MKAIEIKASLENEFLHAARCAGVSVVKKSKVLIAGKVIYAVVAPFSQNDIFRLGVYFSQLTFSKEDY